MEGSQELSAEPEGGIGPPEDEKGNVWGGSWRRDI